MVNRRQRARAEKTFLEVVGGRLEIMQNMLVELHCQALGSMECGRHIGIHLSGKGSGSPSVIVSQLAALENITVALHLNTFGLWFGQDSGNDLDLHAHQHKEATHLVFDTAQVSLDGPPPAAFEHEVTHAVPGGILSLQCVSARMIQRAARRMFARRSCSWLCQYVLTAPHCKSSNQEPFEMEALDTSSEKEPYAWDAGSARQCSAARIIQRAWRHRRLDICGIFSGAAVTCGHFRSFPTASWDKIYSRFTSNVPSFSGVEIVLVVKDFLLSIDQVMSSFGIDVSEMTAKLRRVAEDHFINSGMSGDFSGTHTEVIDSLRQIVTPIQDFVLCKYEVELTASHIDVAEWLRHRRGAHEPKRNTACNSSSHVDALLIEDTQEEPSSTPVKGATPSWTGLRVRRKEAGTITMNSSAINRHGGASSGKASKKERRNNKAGLEKGSDGKHRPRN